jgi:hypothetical protein
LCMGMAPVARPGLSSAENTPRGSVLAAPVSGLLPLVGPCSGPSSETRRTAWQSPGCRPDHGRQYGQDRPCRHFSNNINLRGGWCSAPALFLEPPYPRAADGRGAADRLSDLAQDAAHTPPMPTRNALAVSSMRGIGPVEYLAGAQNAPGGVKGSAYLRLQSTAAGGRCMCPSLQIRVRGPPRRGFAQSSSVATRSARVTVGRSLRGITITPQTV